MKLPNCELIAHLRQRIAAADLTSRYANTNQVVKNIDATSVLMVCGCLFFTCQFLWFSLYPVAALSVMFALAYLPCIYLGRKKLATAAGYYCLLLTIILTFVFSNFVFLGNTGFQLLLILIVPMSFVLLPNASRWLHLTIAMLCAVLMVISEFQLVADGHYQIPSQYRLIAYIVAVLSIAIALHRSLNVCNRSIDAYQQKLTLLAQRDELTGIANRRTFIAALQQASVEVEPVPSCLLMLDLDHFKSVNDSYGHLQGDRALIMAATTVTKLMPAKSMFARLGGEEFAILLRDSQPAVAMQFAEQVRATIAAQSITIDSERSFSCTTSIGVSVLQSDSALSLRQADAALYQAKEAGRNTCVLFEPEPMAACVGGELN